MRHHILMLALALYSAYGTARTDGNGPVTEGNAVAVHVIEKDSEDNCRAQ